MRYAARDACRCDDGGQGIVHNFRSPVLPGQALGPAIRIDERSHAVRASAFGAPTAAAGVSEAFLKLKGIRAIRHSIPAGRRYWRNKA